MDRSDLRQYFVCTCMRERRNDATYFAQKHKIGGQKLEMHYTESDTRPVKMGFFGKPVEVYIYLDSFFTKLA